MKMSNRIKVPLLLGLTNLCISGSALSASKKASNHVEKQPARKTKEVIVQPKKVIFDYLRETQSAAEMFEKSVANEAHLFLVKSLYVEEEFRMKFVLDLPTEIKAKVKKTIVDEEATQALRDDFSKSSPNETFDEDYAKKMNVETLETVPAGGMVRECLLSEMKDGLNFYFNSSNDSGEKYKVRLQKRSLRVVVVAKGISDPVFDVTDLYNEAVEDCSQKVYALDQREDGKLEFALPGKIIAGKGHKSASWQKRMIAKFLKENPLNARQGEEAPFYRNEAVHYSKLRKSLVPKLEKLVTAVNDTRGMQYHVGAVRYFLQERFKKNVNLDESFEWVDIGKNEDRIHYSLTLEHEKELGEYLDTIDLKPKRVTIEVRMLTADRGASREFTSQFGYSKQQLGEGDVATSTKAIATGGVSALTNIFNIGKVTSGGAILDLMISAQENKNKATLLLKEEQSALVDIDKPVVFKRTVNTPISIVTNNTASTVTKEVGLSVTITDLKMTANTAYNEALANYKTDYGEFLKSNKKILGEIGEAIGRGLIESDLGVKSKYNLAAMTNVLQEQARFEQRRAKLNKLLEIRGNLEFKNGSVLQLFQSGGNTAPQSLEILSNSAIEVKSGQPTFVAGVNERHENTAETEPSFLSWLPFIGKLFGSRSKEGKRTSLLIFTTITVADEETDKFTVAKNYTGINQLFGIPISFGGYLPDGIKAHPLKTGLPVLMNWVKRAYETSGDRLKAKQAVTSKAVETLISLRFFQEILKPVYERGQTVLDNKWLDFKHLRKEFDRLANYCRPTLNKSNIDVTDYETCDNSYSLVKRINLIRNQINNLTGGNLTSTDIVAIARMKGRFGAAVDSGTVTDARLVNYFAYVVANENRDENGDLTEKQVFKNEKMIRKFEKDYLGKKYISHKFNAAKKKTAKSKWYLP